MRFRMIQETQQESARKNKQKEFLLSASDSDDYGDEEDANLVLGHQQSRFSYEDYDDIVSQSVLSQNEEVRKGVAEAYAKLVTGPKTGCCGGGRKSAVAEAAGYDPEELAKLPADAVTNSFGCGNPMAFVGVKPGEVVLDLGSGAGIDLLIAADKVGPEGHVIGIDMTDEMVERARKNVEASDHRFSRPVRSVKSIPAASNIRFFTMSWCSEANIDDIPPPMQYPSILIFLDPVRAWTCSTTL